MENPESEVASVEKVVVESVEVKLEVPAVEEPKLEKINVFVRLLKYFSCTTAASVSVEKPGELPKVDPKEEVAVTEETKVEPKEGSAELKDAKDVPKDEPGTCVIA